jgi:peptide/nickel transport system permease protein
MSTSPSPLYPAPEEPLEHDNTLQQQTPVEPIVASTVTPEVPSASGMREHLRDLWRMITLNPKVMIGLIIILFFLLMALFGPVVVRTNPSAFSNARMQPPSAAHWLGTTNTGQDVFAQVVDGARVSVLWGFATGLAATLIALLVGLLAGTVGGLVDELLMLLANIFLVLPGIVLAIVIASFTANTPLRGPLAIAIALVITGWSWTARVLRGQTLSLSKRDFVEAARASGESLWRIIVFEILPNEISIVIAGFVGTVLYVILADAALEFIGVGDPSIISWGNMFYWAGNNDALLLGAWWWFVPPGLCVALIGVGLALLNFGIDEIANPRLRREAKVKPVKGTQPGQSAQPAQSRQIVQTKKGVA